MPYKKFKGQPHAWLRELKGQPLKVKVDVQ